MSSKCRLEDESEACGKDKNYCKAIDDDKANGINEIDKPGQT
jgi:hypothetical protein